MTKDGAVVEPGNETEERIASSAPEIDCLLLEELGADGGIIAPIRANARPVCILGLRLVPWSTEQVLEEVDRRIAQRDPCFFITANLHYAMLSARDERLRQVNSKAAFLLADGMPLVWIARWKRTPLRVRVAGADLVDDLCRQAARVGHRVFLLGGAPGVATDAARVLCLRHPGLHIAGTDSPPFRELSPAENASLVRRIRDARTDLLFVAFGQPKGEMWLAENVDALGVPACVQVGASLDFVAGKVARAPRWAQRLGLEWLHRIACEPARLGPRYLANGWFLAWALLAELPNKRS